MRHVLHVVVTGNFAGTERYMASVANETTRQGWRVTVIGGDPNRMSQELDVGVRWLPGATVAEALRSVARAGRADVCHAHLTSAEAVAVVTRRLHRGRIVCTRHIAAPRGSSRLGHVLRPWIEDHLDAEIAISQYVASRIGRRPMAVVPPGVCASPVLWRSENNVVLVVQRLEPEKDTMTALRAWLHSALPQDGWQLRILGEGSERRRLEAYIAQSRLQGVQLLGHVPDVAVHLREAGALLATCPVEGQGLAVLEAMAAGIPVVAAGSGGHLETIGRACPRALFGPGDAVRASELLNDLMDPESRSEQSVMVRRWQRGQMTVEGSVVRLIETYEVGAVVHA